MVDLAKIRKKAKGKSSSRRVDDSTSEAPASATPVPSPPPLDDSTTRPLDDSPATPTKLEKFKEQAGKRREAAVEQVVQAAGETLELLTFIIAGEQYAVDIERIVEIVTARAVTRIPNADPAIVGIISLRGTIVTLVDVRRKLRHPDLREAGADSRVVVIDFHNETIGFLVDRVLRVVKIAPGDVEPHPVVHAAELEAAIRGVFRVSGALTILLDLDKLLDSRAVAARSA